MGAHLVNQLHHSKECQNWRRWCRFLEAKYGALPIDAPARVLTANGQLLDDTMFQNRIAAAEELMLI